MQKFNSCLEAFSELPLEIDYFLTCLSYEDRCLTPIGLIKENRIKNFLLFYMEEYIYYTNKHKEKFKKAYPNLIECALSTSNPIQCADQLINVFSKNFKRNSNLVIDISTFTRESLLILIKFFYLNKNSFNEIYLFYRAAEVSGELSSMINQIRSVLGYMGELDQSKPLHLILLSGFEFHRAKEMIETIQPDYISIGYGEKSSSISKDLYLKNIEFKNQLLSFCNEYKNIQEFTHSLISIESVTKKINKVISKNPEHNFVLAPLSNKISTIGIALTAIKNPSIQICYSEVSNYNVNGYSKPLDMCFLQKINFSTF